MEERFTGLRGRLSYGDLGGMGHFAPFCLMKDQCVFTSRRNLFRCNATVSGVNDRRRVSVLFVPQTPEFCFELFVGMTAEE